MAEWEGKSKGTPLGYKIFIFIIKKIGISAAYLLLYPVVGYYVLFSTQSNPAIKDYFSRVRAIGKSEVKPFLFSSYYKLGHVLIDIVSIISSAELQLELEREGMKILEAMDAQKSGGFFICA